MAADKNKIIQVPYRQSALTRILETALGGNSVTTMICAVSPANDNYEQTLSTLRYADQTKELRTNQLSMRVQWIKSSENYDNRMKD